MKKFVVAALASASLFTMAAPAQAGEYLGVYTSTGATPLNGRFAITTSDTINPTTGGFDILSISGLIDGTALTGLVPTSAGSASGAAGYGYPNGYLSTSGNFIYDNALFFPGTPSVDVMGFLVNAANGLEYNLFFDAGAYTLYSGNPAGGLGANSVGTFALTAVPEPATWAMMIVGFGLLGGAMRRRQQAVRVRYA